MTDKRFDHKVAIVTGAGRSMGRATALTLAAGGASVVVNDVEQLRADSVVEEIVNAGGDALAVVADISNLKEVEQMVQTTVAHFGTVDGGSCSG